MMTDKELMHVFIKQLIAAGADGDAVYCWSLCGKAAEEIERMSQEMETLKIEIESANSEYKRMSAEAGGKIKALRSDAERYRFIRNDCGSLEMGFYENGWDDRLREWLSHDSLDNIIDAAIAQATVKLLEQ